MQLIRAWSPAGVDHFYNLARAGYYDDTRFFRVPLGFVAQFGLPANPALARYGSRQYVKPDRPDEKKSREKMNSVQLRPQEYDTRALLHAMENP